MVHRAGFPFRAAAGLLLIAAVLRLGTALSRVDEQNPEELYRGALAQAWIEGAPIWPGAAPQVEHLRGSLLVSALAVPLFAVLGPTTFALRQSGLLFHLAGLLLFMLLAQRLFGRRAAVLAGALFVLAPPALAKIAALSYGDHMESVPFVCAAALAVHAWLEPRRAGATGATSEASSRRALLAGLALGLAMSWHAQARLGALVLLGACAIAAPRRLLRRESWLGLLPGLLMGLLPIAALDWWTARPGWQVFGADPLEQLAGHAELARGTKWLRFWVADLPQALQFPWPAAGAALCALAALAVAWLAAGAWRTRATTLATLAALARPSWRFGFLVGYPLAFSLAYALSRFAIHPGADNAIQARFVLPIVPFLLLLPLAVAGARLWDGGRRALAALLVAPALGLGAAGSLSTWDLDSLRHEPARRAVNWEAVVRHLQWGSLHDAERAALRRLELESYGDPQQDALVAEFIEQHADPSRFVALVLRYDDQRDWTAKLRFRVPGLPRPMPSALAELSPELRAWAVATVGAETGEARRPPGRAAQVGQGSDCSALLRACNADERVLFSRSFGSGLAVQRRPQLLDGRVVAERLARPPSGVDARQAAFGYGTRAGSIVHAFFPTGDRIVTEFVTHVERGLQPPFARGLGAGYRWRLLAPPDASLRSPAVERLVGLLPPELAPEFRAGLLSDAPLETQDGQGALAEATSQSVR